MPVETVAVLTDTAANAQTVWIGYVDNNGGASERLVDPLRVQGGWLTAYDHVRDAVRTFAVHRITGVAPIAE
jgi:predicted DNA-binding transcriptional regulator YafY